MATERSNKCLSCGAFKEYETQDGQTVEICPRGCVSARRIVPRREASEIEMSLGEKLRALRGSRSQKAVAEAVGVKDPTWCTWEAGKFTPKEQYWPAIAKALGTTVERLFGESNGEVKPIAAKKSTAVVVTKPVPAHAAVVPAVVEPEPEPAKPSTHTLRIAGLTIDLPGIGTIEELMRRPDGSYRVVLTVKATEA